MRDRERLSRQRRLVDHGQLTLYRPINRDDLAGADHDPVSDRDLPDRNFLDFLVLAAVGDPRSALEQCSELASRTPAGGRLEAFPPLSIKAITAPARYSPSASAPTMATSAIASTPTSPRISVRSTDQVSGISVSTIAMAQTRSPAWPGSKMWTTPPRD